MALLPRAVVHNWRLKLAALGLSIFLWALVQTEPRTAESFEVPVRVDVADTAWTQAGPPRPATVELRLSGPTGEIIDLAQEGTFLRIPVQRVTSADTVVALRREWVALGEGSPLSVESVSPNTIRLTFEPAVTRVLPVALRVEGELPEDVALASPIGMNPQVVRVRGPASAMAELDSVRLVPLDLASVEESGIYEVPLDTTGLGGIRITPTGATLGIRVEERVTRTVGSVPVQIQLPRQEMRLVVAPETIRVELRGARTLVAAVDPRDLRGVVRAGLVEELLPGEERSVPVRIDGVPSLVAARPLTPTVTVRRLAEDGGDGGGQP